MHLFRTVRGTLLATSLVLSGVAVAALPAGAAVVKAIVFPVDGAVTYTDTFGACRGTACERRHEGQDLMGKKMLPLLAAVDGTVHRVVFSNTSLGGNSVTIKATDGWTYHYIHVNNDTPGTDDGSATRDQAFPAGIIAGAKVTRGQVVAYLGDSGNAEDTAPHLHFEIREPPLPGGHTGTAINPYESLRQATVWTSAARWDLRSTATAGDPQQFSYGLQTGDLGLLCDWDADGTDEVVIFRSGTWHLRNGTSSGTTAQRLAFGAAGDLPLCADVDGDGHDEPVLFRAGGRWTMRAGFAAADPLLWTVRYGMQTGDRPVLGDWDGDGDGDLGIHRSSVWHIRSTGSRLGSTTATFRYGMQSADLPVAGDWDGDGDDDAGIFRRGEWHLRSTAQPSGGTTSTFKLGVANGQPVVGAGSDPVKPGAGTFRART